VSVLRCSMDVVAHGLWATAGAVGLRRKTRIATSLVWAAFWGVFPDLFSFAIPATVRIWWRLTGATQSLLPDANGPQHFEFVWQLYHCSHSLVVFGLAFGLVWLFTRRPVFSMLGWALHIAVDIFTHRGIFATHFLWPFSSFGWDGTPWESPWFLAANYATLAAVYLLLIRSARSASRRRTAISGAEEPRPTER
jgi:hypothetical protein